MQDQNFGFFFFIFKNVSKSRSLVSGIALLIRRVVLFEIAAVARVFATLGRSDAEGSSGLAGGVEETEPFRAILPPLFALFDRAIA